MDASIRWIGLFEARDKFGSAPHLMVLRDSLYEMLCISFIYCIDSQSYAPPAQAPVDGHDCRV
jgi:hypothetical protein